MIKQKTKYLWVGVLVALLLLCVAAATTAFTTRSATADNVLTFGSLQLELQQFTLSAGQEIPYTGQDPVNITASSQVSRIVRIKNVCDHPMYVRVALRMQGTRGDGTPLDMTGLVDYRLNTTDWTGRDGWYYYTKPLEPGQTTPDLLTAIEFESNAVLAQGGAGCSMDLDINAQAVQSENNAAAVLDAAGWPQ